MSHTTLPDSQSRAIGSIDFASPEHLRRSYAVRAAGVLCFGVIFVAVIMAIHPELPLALESFVGISVASWPGWLSVVLVVADVVVVLFLHELVHAAVFWLSAGAPAKIGARSFLIYAAAPGYRIARNWMIVNALAPFGVISLAAIPLLTLHPSVVPWVFIPAVANAAAAGGDFMGAFALARWPAETLVEDDGTKLSLFAPDGARP